MTGKSKPHATHGHRGHVPTSAAKITKESAVNHKEIDTNGVNRMLLRRPWRTVHEKPVFGQGLNSAVLNYPSKTFSFIILDPSRRSNLGPLDLEKEVPIFELAQGLRAEWRRGKDMIPK